MRRQVRGGCRQVDHAAQAARPGEGEDAVLCGKPGQGGVAEAVLAAAHRQGPPVEGEHRLRVAALPVDGVRGPAGGLRQPGFAVRAEPGVGGVGLPGQRDAAAVAPRVGAAGAEVHGVLDAVERHVGLGQTQFLPLVEMDGSGQSQRQQGGGAGASGPSSRSVGVPKALVAKSKAVSRRPYRVTVRGTSWLHSTQVAGAPTGVCARRACRRSSGAAGPAPRDR